MFHATHEIRTQPEDWRRIAQESASHAHVLPRRGERVAFTGCGTSWFMSMSAAWLYEAAGFGEADAYTSSEFNFGRKYDRVIAVTRSGTTTEVIELLERLKGVVPTTVITAIEDSPVAAVADHAIVLPWVDEQSVIVTRFATTVLGLMRAHFGDDLHQAATDAEWAIDAPIDELATAEQISFLGSGWTVGLAHEAALKTREAAQFWAESHPAMDYRHGPISIAQPGRLVWCFGPVPEGLDDQVRGLGAGFESNTIDPMAHLVLAQRVAVQIAANRGLNPDTPRGLARSIILG
jgi:fructoselysine-6-P-deglycase FrlB-like protein